MIELIAYILLAIFIMAVVSHYINETPYQDEFEFAEKETEDDSNGHS